MNLISEKSGLRRENSIGIIMVSFLLLGSLAGALMSNLCGEIFESHFIKDGSFYLNVFITTDLDTKILIKNILKTRLEFFFCIIIVLLTRIKEGLFSVILFVVGFCGGVLISENTLHYIYLDCFANEYIGVLVYIASITPQYLFYCLAIYILYKFCIKKNETAKHIIIVTIIAALLFIAGALCEACINPYIMKIILNKVGNI